MAVFSVGAGEHASGREYERQQAARRRAGAALFAGRAAENGSGNGRRGSRILGRLTASREDWAAKLEPGQA
jgi:hypothetical protein